MLSLAPCWNAWDWSADGDSPFRGYLDRMRTLRRCGAERAAIEFRRPTAEESARVHYEHARRGRDAASGLGGAVSADLAKTVAAAEMRNRARAIGVNRTGLASSSMIEIHATKSGRVANT